jgi:outer membrane protein OmpA-like peptidoglycan-associated protein
MKSVGTILLLICSLTIYGQNIQKDFKSFYSKDLEIGDKIIAPTIGFSLSGGSLVMPEYYDSVKVMADFLISNPKLIIEIGVYTDSRGNAKSNLRLSEMRAKSIKELLENEFKIQSERMTVKGYGESIPIVVIDDIEQTISKEELHLLNRRVEITIL